MDDAPIPADPADLLPTRSFGYRLWMLRHAWTRRAEAAMAPTGLTHMQFFVLRALEHASATGMMRSQTQLAGDLHIDRMTVSKVVRTIESKGLAVRGVHPADPRANSVALTPAGLELVRHATALVFEEQEAFFGHLGQDGKAAFGTMLDQLLGHEARRSTGNGDGTE